MLMIIRVIGQLFSGKQAARLQDFYAAAVRQTGAAWLDVSSGVEQAPGIKSRDLMANFIRQARG